MVPLVTVITLSYAGLLEGSVLTETVFAWPGLGLYITNSLQNADMNAGAARLWSARCLLDSICCPTCCTARSTRGPVSDEAAVFQDFKKNSCLCNNSKG